MGVDEFLFTPTGHPSPFRTWRVGLVSKRVASGYHRARERRTQEGIHEYQNPRLRSLSWDWPRQILDQRGMDASGAARLWNPLGPAASCANKISNFPIPRASLLRTMNNAYLYRARIPPDDQLASIRRQRSIVHPWNWFFMKIIDFFFFRRTGLVGWFSSWNCRFNWDYSTHNDFLMKNFFKYYLYFFKSKN